jgi:hypothetical protein
MPLAFLAVVGFVLVVLLFSADATLEKLTQASIQSPVGAPALVTHVISEPVHAAQVAPEDDPVSTDPAAQAARAEAPPTKERVTRTRPPVGYRQNNASSHREFGLSGLQ